jgi:hypothetical protein
MLQRRNQPFKTSAWTCPSIHALQSVPTSQKLPPVSHRALTSIGNSSTLQRASPLLGPQSKHSAADLRNSTATLRMLLRCRLLLLLLH